MDGKRRIRVIGRHSTEEIADHHRRRLEEAQANVRTGCATDTEVRALASADVTVSSDLTTRHERFRRLKWAVGVFV